MISVLASAHPQLWSWERKIEDQGSARSLAKAQTVLEISCGLQSAARSDIAPATARSIACPGSICASAGHKSPSDA